MVRSYDDLVAALIAQKNALGLSNSVLEHICGLATGHADKVLGRARSKSIGKWLLGVLLEGLALELVPRVNPDALKRSSATLAVSLAPRRAARRSGGTTGTPRPQFAAPRHRVIRNKLFRGTIGGWPCQNPANPRSSRFWC